jgi:hypothetical protein
MESEDPPANNARMYGEFPLSIRIAQRSIVAAAVIPFFCVRVLLKPKKQGETIWLQIAVGVVSGICAAVGLLATYYAVIRYPYMGLVDAADGDLFHKYLVSKSKGLQFLAKCACLMVAGGGVIAPMLDGQITGIEWLVISYAALVFLFLIFLLVYYHRFDHPAVATFLRCSMGIGIFLFPFFLPALIIGSMRADKLLDEEIMKLEAEKKRMQQGFR